jgi:hypothetical protein
LFGLEIETDEIRLTVRGLLNRFSVRVDCDGCPGLVCSAAFQLALLMGGAGQPVSRSASGAVFV